MNGYYFKTTTMTKLNKLSTETVTDFGVLAFPKKDNAELPYYEESSQFSTASIKENVNHADLQQVREWKNILVKMRDRHKGSELYYVFN